MKKTPEELKTELIQKLQEFREIAEEIILDPESYNVAYRMDLKEISQDMFELQIKLADKL